MLQSDKLNILGCELVLTCHSCPEQYDVYYEGANIGYLRLRWGHFVAQLHGPWGPVVYRGAPAGFGMFEPEEREKFLGEAVKELLERVKSP